MGCFNMSWKYAVLFLLIDLLKMLVLGVATTYIISVIKGTPYTWNLKSIVCMGLAIDLVIEIGSNIIKDD